jgi:hypothetical protein
MCRWHAQGIWKQIAVALTGLAVAEQIRKVPLTENDFPSQKVCWFYARTPVETNLKQPKAKR